MFEFLVLIAFCYLFIKVIGLAFRVTWGLAKFAAMCLLVLAALLFLIFRAFSVKEKSRCL